MRKYILMAFAGIFCLSLLSCANGGKQTQEKSEVKTVANNEFKVDDVLNVASDFIDQEVVITGHVSHTCKHSGKRCFLVGDNESFSVRVEAGGDIVGFNRELVGNTIKVTGILQERRLSQEYLSQWEEKLKAKAVKEDGSPETCSAEMNNINDMRTWMEENGKDYYSIYYLNGTSYEVVD